MRGNFSPMAEAARLRSARPAAARPVVPSAGPVCPSGPAVTGERWCEWPPRPASHPPFTGIRQALLAIQAARHA
jgi:hypothetical protein